MRPYAAAVLLTLTILPSARVLAAGDHQVDSEALAMMEGKAAHASLRDQCFLYAQLVHSMTEVASRQISDGEPAEAAATLASVQHYADLLDAGLARDTKKVKDAEILMRQTALRLKTALNAAAVEDRPAVERTIQQLDKVESKLMMQVFEH
jgi:peptidyl-tRNA hydrolase